VWGPSGRALPPSSVLVDLVAATWKVTRERGTATMAVRGFRQLTPAERTEIEAEGAALLAFPHPGDIPDVRVS